VAAGEVPAISFDCKWPPDWSAATVEIPAGRETGKRKVLAQPNSLFITAYMRLATCGVVRAWCRCHFIATNEGNFGAI